MKYFAWWPRTNEYLYADDPLLGLHISEDDGYIILRPADLSSIGAPIYDFARGAAAPRKIKANRIRNRCLKGYDKAQGG